MDARIWQGLLMLDLNKIQLEEQLTHFGLELRADGRIRLKPVVENILFGLIDWTKDETTNLYTTHFHGVDFTAGSLGTTILAEQGIRRQALEILGYHTIVIKVPDDTSNVTA